MKKKLLSGALALCMVLSLLPATALAADVDSVGDSTETEEHVHNYTKLVGVLKPATCSSSGIGQYECECGEKTYLMIDPTHTAPADESKITVVEPTCVDAGSRTYVCDVCGETVTETLEATGVHTYELAYVEATCTKGQIVGYVCTVCGAVDESRDYTELEVTALGHDFALDTNDEDYKAATCTEGGVAVYVCQREDCDGGTDKDGHGSRYTEEVEKLGHDYQPYGDQKGAEGDTGYVEATCTKSNGIREKCSVCEDIKWTPFTEADAAYEAPLGHTWTATETVEADCATETDGISGGQVCSVCGEAGTGSTAEGGNGGEKATVTQWTHTEATKDEIIQAATCNAAGSKKVITYCTVCNKVISTGDEVEIPQLTGEDAHKPVLSSTPLKTATCTSSGIGKYVCEVCGKDLGYQTIDPVAHTKPTDPSQITTVAATCLEEGSVTYTCTVCREEVTDTLDKLDHDFTGVTPTYTATINGETVTLTATQAAAYTCVDVTATYVCKTEGCEETKTETREAADGHTEENGLAYVDGDCTKGTVVNTVCSVCGEIIEEGSVLPGSAETAHKLVAVTDSELNKAATCEEAGVQVYKCSNEGCTHTEKKEIPALGHNWVTVGMVDATCTSPAGAKEECNVCHETRVTPFDDDLLEAIGGQQLSHDLEEVDEVAATCTEDGMKAHYACKNCGGLFVEDEENDGEYVEVTAEDLAIEATGHNTTGVDATVVTDKTGEYAAVPATCEEDGYHYTVKICSECGEADETTYEKVEDPADSENGHVPVLSGTPLKEMNCVTNTAGIGKYVCEVCGKDLGYQTIDVAHTLDNGTMTKAATCTEAGEMTYQCTVSGCTHTETKEIKALGHDFESDTNPTASADYTCADYTLTYHCQNPNCTETRVVEVEGDGNHNYADVTVPATCTENAKTGSFCQDCGAQEPGTTYVETPDSALGHHWVLDEDNEANQDATCTEDGTKVYVCDREDCDGGENGEPATKTEKVEATGHTWTNQVAVAANCEHGAGVSQTCSVCGETEVDEFEGALVEPKLEHSYVDVETSEATCTEPGVTGGKVCEYCGAEDPDNKIVTTPALGHNHSLEEGDEPDVVRENEVAATCTQEGSYDEVIYCADCGAEVSRETKTTEIDPDNHTGLTQAATPLKDPTCSATGIGALKCTDCEAELGYQILDKLDHTKPATGVDTTPATCTEDGEVSYTCTVCHEEVTETIEALGHDFSGTPVYSSNYTCQDRTATYTCTHDGCEETKVVNVPATADHTYVVKTVAATCTTPEQFGYVCSVCDDAKGALETVYGSEPLGHDWDKTTVLTDDDRYEAATCTETGTAVYPCKNCDATTTETTEALGHSYGAPVYHDATCEAYAYVEETCTRADCDEDTESHTKTTTFEALGYADHTLVHHAAAAATCTVDGNKEYWECSVCKKLFNDADGKTEIVDKDSIVVKAEGHDYGEGVCTDATCTAYGYTTYTCQNEDCDEGEDEHGIGGTYTVEDKDSGYAAHVPVTADLIASQAYQNADCGEEVAFTTFECAVCHQTITADPGDSIKVTKAHEYDEGVVTTPATCTAEGVMTYTCKNCDEGTEGHTKTEVIPKTAHDFTGDPVYTVTINGVEIEITAAKAATYTCLDVTATYTCQNDGCSEMKEITTKATAEHDFEEGYTEADCTHPILVGSICSVCGQADGEITELGEPLGHDYQPTENNDFTDCTVGGTIEYKCTRCGDVTTEEKEAGQHKFADDDTGTYVDATCTEPAKLVKTCIICGKEVEDPSFDGSVLDPAKGHAETYAVLTIEATCEHGGFTISYCPDCTEVDSETGEVLSGTEFTKSNEVSATSHTWELIKKVEATCSTGGYEEYKCSVCGETEKRNETDPDPTKHVYEFDLTDLTDKSKVLKAPTCTSTGIGMGTCKECGGTGWAVIPALGHDLTTVTVDPTCTTVGSKTTTCSNCDYEEVEVLPMIAHDWRQVFDPQSGQLVVKCSMCNAIQTEGDAEETLVINEIVESAKTPAPVEDEEPAPIEAEAPTPVEAEAPTPVEAEDPVPIEAEAPTPVEVEDPVPVENEDPAPVEDKDPAPVEDENPAE